MYCARMRNTVRSHKWSKPAWIKGCSRFRPLKLYMFIRESISRPPKGGGARAVASPCFPPRASPSTQGLTQNRSAKRICNPCTRVQRKLVNQRAGAAVGWLTLYSGLSTPLRRRGEASPLPLGRREPRQAATPALAISGPRAASSPDLFLAQIWSVCRRRGMWGALVACECVPPGCPSGRAGGTGPACFQLVLAELPSHVRRGL